MYIHLYDNPLGKVLLYGANTHKEKSEIVKAIVRTPVFPKLKKISPLMAFITTAQDDKTNRWHSIVVRRKNQLERIASGDFDNPWTTMVQSQEGFILPEAALRSASKQFPVLAVLQIRGGQNFYEYWSWDEIPKARLSVVAEAEAKRARKRLKLMGGKK